MEWNLVDHFPSEAVLINFEKPCLTVEKYWMLLIRSPDTAVLLHMAEC